MQTISPSLRSLHTPAHLPFIPPSPQLPLHCAPSPTAALRRLSGRLAPESPSLAGHLARRRSAIIFTVCQDVRRVGGNAAWIICCNHPTPPRREGRGKRTGRGAEGGQRCWGVAGASGPSWKRDERLVAHARTNIMQCEWNVNVDRENKRSQQR